MTASPAGPNGDRTVVTFRQFQWLEGAIAICALLVAIAFNLIHLYPEVSGDVVARNDNVMHVLLTDAVVKAIIHRQDFTDPWESTMSMGFPLFHYYQHLPHVTVALFHVLTLGAFPVTDLMRWITYLLLSLFPLSIYWSLRRFGFDRISSAMGGLVASLVATAGIFGLGFASYVYQGLGVYTQLWAMVLLPSALALGYRVLREGRGYFWATLLLAATLMSHLMYGYMAFLTLGILTFIQPVQWMDLKSLMETIWRRWRRLIILFLLVVIVTSYFLGPLFLDRQYLNRSVWHDLIMYDSYGHGDVLLGLVKGNLFDFGRLPSLTVLVFVGLVICLLRWREESYRISVAIFLMWLLLFFGRATWGGLVDLLPMSHDLHMRRFIAGVHLGGICLMAAALAAPWRWVVSRSNLWYVVAALALTLLVLLPVYIERRSYLAQNAFWIKELQYQVAVDGDLRALFEKLKHLPPGRVYAGHHSGASNHWSDQHRVGGFKVYYLLHAEGVDMMGKVYHSFSLNSDVLINFDEQRWDHYNLYNARYIVAPEEQVFPDFVQPLQQFGRHHLYQVETTGYFDLVGSDLAFAGGRTDFYPAASSWLASGLPGVNQHPGVLIGNSPRGAEHPVPLSTAMDVIPRVQAFSGPPRGEVLSEDIGSHSFAAEVRVERESLLMLKATYHPNWRATINGVTTDTVMLMPSFVGVRLPPGDHQVRMEYRPRRLRVALLGLGLFTLPLIAISEKWGAGAWSWFATSVLARISDSVKRPRNTRRSRRCR